MIALTQYVGDSKTHSIPMTWEGQSFTPDSQWLLLLSVKLRKTDADRFSLFQKALGAGITVSGSTASISVVPTDTNDAPATTYFGDIQAQSTTTGQVRTVAEFELVLEAAPTRNLQSSIEIHTAQPAYPNGPAGPPNVLTIGTVTTGEANTNASATISGTSPAQVLNLTIPKGRDGVNGSDAEVTGANMATGINAASEKTTPSDADKITITDSDSADSGSLKWLSWQTVKNIFFADATTKADAAEAAAIAAAATDATTKAATKANLTGGNAFTGTQQNSGIVTSSAALGTDATQLPNQAQTKGLISKLQTNYIFLGDSTVAPNTGTKGAAEPGSVAPFYGYPGVENPENWVVMLRNKMPNKSAALFANKGIGGRTLVQVRDAFAVDMAEYALAAGQKGVLTLVGGHNDFQALGASAASTYAVALEIRDLAVAMGYEVVYVPPVWHINFPDKCIDISRLAVADIGTKWLSVIDQGYSGGFNFPWDTVHQTMLGNKCLASRWWNHVILRESLLDDSTIRCGSNGDFITVQAALYWCKERRLAKWPSSFIFDGVNVDNYVNLATTSGDGRWLGWSNPINIEVTHGSTLSIVKRIDFASSSIEQYNSAKYGSYNDAKPSALFMIGDGRVDWAFYNEGLNVGTIPNRLECKVNDMNPSTNAVFYGKPLVLGGTWLCRDAGLRESSPFAGCFHMNASVEILLLNGMTLYQKNNSAIFSMSNGTTVGVYVGDGCQLITQNSGSITNNLSGNNGRIFFAGQCIVSNSTQSPGQTWVGATPTVPTPTDHANILKTLPL
jgi:hypothetical protein